MATSESGQMQEMWNNNTAGELHYKIAMRERSWVSLWLIPQAQPSDEYSVLLFTKLPPFIILLDFPEGGKDTYSPCSCLQAMGAGLPLVTLSL